nr:hypothetical protein [Tanacetum cinerariifolium]
MAKFVSNPLQGLETMSTYPYEGQTRHHCKWTNLWYIERGHPRYYLTNILQESDPTLIEERLRQNFLGGPQFPMVADIVVGDLVDFVAAKARACSHEIYRHQDRLLNRKMARHSVLVVRIDVTSKDRIGHYAEVKNTWGAYGDNGFTRVGFEVLRKIWWPAPSQDGGALYGINP